MCGSDSDAINRFMALGRSVAASGGVFDCSFDECMRIDEVVLQTASMAKYAMAYNNFTILDGTFLVTAYDLMLIIATNVDCLGKSVMTGYVFAESENSEAAVRGLQAFKLERVAATLMTDGASSYAVTAQECKMVHILCVQHYRTTLMSAKSGMPQELGAQFLKDCNALIFNVFPTIACFNGELAKCKQTYNKFPAASKFMDRLERDAERVCASYTSRHFTAGHVASQRAESNNARVKQDALLKEDLKKFNLLET